MYTTLEYVVQKRIKNEAGNIWVDIATFKCQGYAEEWGRSRDCNFWRILAKLTEYKEQVVYPRSNNEEQDTDADSEDHVLSGTKRS